jgi:dTDP-4-amino-4,6-dideoxygalactose transaminase
MGRARERAQRDLERHRPHIGKPKGQLIVESIPLVDLAAQHRDIDDGLLSAIDQVLRSGAFIGGPAVSAFEQSYARYLGVTDCIGVANGTDALEIALRAVGVERDAEVIMPANTFIATLEAVARVGARPVLVDVDPDTLLMDAAQVSSVVTGRTQAIVPVHLYGQAAPVEKIAVEAPGIPIVEDAAQSQGAMRHGRSAGSLGTVAATSFYPGKNLGAAGDAGAVLTSEPAVARMARLLGSHGSATKYVHEIVGFNSRLDAIQAIVLEAKLAHLDRWNHARRQAARRYDELLAGVAGVELPVTLPGNEHVWHLYVIRVDERDRVLAQLNAAGIGAGIHYPVPVHLTEAFRGLGHQVGDFPTTERAARRILSLPLYPHITEAQQVRVVETLVHAIS